MVAGKQQLCILLPLAPLLLAEVGGGSGRERHPGFRGSWFGVSINYATDFPMLVARCFVDTPPMQGEWFLAVEKAHRTSQVPAFPRLGKSG